MSAGRHFRDNTPERHVQFGLRCDHAGEDARLFREHGRRGLITGSFDAEEVHKRLTQRRKGAKNDWN